MANEYANIDIVLELTGAEDVKVKLEKIEQISKKVETVLNKLAGLNARAKIDAEDKATEKIKAINHKIASIVGKTYAVTITAKDKISNVIHGITSKIKGLTGILTSPLGFIGLGAFTGGFGAIVKESLNIAGEMEQANIAFTTMLKSGERAREFLKELETFSIQTPFELPQLMDASRKLLAYGFSAKKIIPILKDVGNATAGLGLGSEGIARITLALGQMRAKSKVTGEEMRQLAEAGIPAWQYIAKMLGVTTQQAMKLSEKGLIPAEKGIEAILKGMRKDFAGLLEKQSRTLFGLLSTLKDFARLKIFGAFGEGLRRGLLPLLTKVTDYLTKNKKGAGELENTFLRFGKKVGDFVVKALEKVYALIKDIMNPKFKADLGEKILKVFENIISQVNSWLGGEGGKKLSGTFYNIGVIAGKAWIRALIDTFKSGISELFKGNILGSLFSLSLFGFLGGGKILGAALKLGKGIFKLGSLVTSKIKPVFVAQASTGVENITGIPQVTSIAGKISVPMLSKTAMLLKAGIDIFRITKAKDKLKTTVGIGGEWGGMLVGAKIGAGIGTMIAPGVGTAVGGAIGGIIGTILGGKLGTGIVELFRKNKAEEKIGISNTIAKVKPYAYGGIVKRPTLGLIGEKGPEVIIPLYNRERAHKLLLITMEKLGIEHYAEEKSYKKFIEELGRSKEIKNTTTRREFIKSIIPIKSYTYDEIIKKPKLIHFGEYELLQLTKRKLGVSNTKEKLEIDNVITKVKPYVYGGIIQRPTFAIIGEKGKEIVIPLYNRERATKLVMWTERELGIERILNSTKTEKEFTHPIVFSMKSYAYGGIVQRPTLGLIGEKGIEIIIPLYNKERSIKLLSFAVEKLGIKHFAEGGIIGNISYNYASSKSSQLSQKTISLNINRIDVSIEGDKNNIDYEELANQIGKKITVQIRRAIENR